MGKRNLVRQRILICGDRDWKDIEALIAVLEQHLNPAIDFIIHGDARGADRLGADIAEQNGVSKNRIRAFPADWTRYRRAAGPIRNQQMLDEGRPTLVLAFHDDITKSKGTKDMIKRAMRAGLPVYLNGHALPLKLPPKMIGKSRE